MWNFVLFLLLAVAPVSRSEVREHVDLVELNSFHDASGRFVYDQVIFYEWDHAFARYHVRAWVLSDGDKQPQRDYRNGLWIVRYTDRDQKLERVITATHFRRSWTQKDPERDDKKHLREEDRHGLIKRIIKPIPDDTPMLEVDNGVE